jgi:hypothetical protein
VSDLSKIPEVDDKYAGMSIKRAMNIYETLGIIKLNTLHKKGTSDGDYISPEMAIHVLISKSMGLVTSNFAENIAFIFSLVASPLFLISLRTQTGILAVFQGPSSIYFSDNKDSY